MQKKLDASFKLPDTDGRVIKSGWTTGNGIEYEPRNIKLERMKMKEWDSYILVSGSGEYAFSMCLSDKRSVGQASACFYDIKNGMKYDCYNPKLLPGAKICLSHSGESGSAVVKDAFCDFMYLVNPGDRHLYCKYSHVFGADVEANVHLGFDNEAESLSVVTVFDDESTQFCYNRKFTCMPANGSVNVNDETFVFSPEKDFAVFDMGRGVWAGKTKRCWCAGSTVIDGKTFGFNIGYGFGKTSEVSENAVFYDGVCHKLDKIFIDIPSDNLSDVWHIRSNDKRFEMSIIPLYNTENKNNFGFVDQCEKLMFGKISGTVILDDGTELEINDMVCFCERSQNKY